MSRRQTVTYICDACGLQQSHELLSSGFHEQVYTMVTYPDDWTVVKLEGGSDLSPQRDYCPQCKEHGYGKEATEAKGLRQVQRTDTQADPSSARRTGKPSRKTETTQTS